MFCPDFCVAREDGQVAQTETTAMKICAMPKNSPQDLVS
jgi:hypothetical protein